MRQQARMDKLTVCYCKKQMGVSFSFFCPVIGHKFRHNIVKVAVDPQSDICYIDFFYMLLHY